MKETARSLTHVWNYRNIYIFHVIISREFLYFNVPINYHGILFLLQNHFPYDKKSNNKCLLAIHSSSKAPLAYHRQHPPKHIMKLLCYEDLECSFTYKSKYFSRMFRSHPKHAQPTASVPQICIE